MNQAEMHNHQIQGAPQAYLPFVVPGWQAASMAVKRRSTRAPDLNAVECMNKEKEFRDET